MDQPTNKNSKSNANASATTAGKNRYKSRPLNRYNIFFILERERILQSKGATPKIDLSTVVTDIDHGIKLPPFPPRFKDVIMRPNWFHPRGEKERKKRLHVKTHGIMSFKELAKETAANWKSVDYKTYEYVAAVEKALKESHENGLNLRKLAESREKEAPQDQYQENASAPIPTTTPSCCEIEPNKTSKPDRRFSLPAISRQVTISVRVEVSSALSPQYPQIAGNTNSSLRRSSCPEISSNPDVQDYICGDCSDQSQGIVNNSQCANEPSHLARFPAIDNCGDWPHMFNTNQRQAINSLSGYGRRSSFPYVDYVDMDNAEIQRMWNFA